MAVIVVAVVATLTGSVSAIRQDGTHQHGQHHLITEFTPVAADSMLPKTGWTVSADSQQAGFAAANAIDGNPDTIWHSEFAPDTAEPPHTITIDMHASNTVTGLRYLPRTDHANGTIGAFHVHTSPDAATWAQVATGTFTDDKTEKLIPFTPANTRYVRLTASTEAGNRGPWSSAAEINLTGNPVPTLPRAGWTVAADSQQDTLPASNVLDGDPGTIWHTEFEPTVAQLPHTFTIDMHATNVVSGLRYLPRTDHPNGAIGAYQIRVSSNGTAWTQVATGTFADNLVETTVPFAPTNARYVRLTATSEAGNRGPWTTAAEINLTGNPIPTLNRAAWTVTADSMESGYPDYLAIDGNPATIWHTAFTPGPAPLPHTFTIDMHATNVVSGLRYLPRTDHPNGAIGAYKIHVSSNGTAWTQVATGTFANDQTEKAVSFTPTNTRYVRLTAIGEAGNRGPWTTAAEINLTGGAPPVSPQVGGRWGPTTGFPLVPAAAAQLPDGTLLTWSAFDPYDYEPGGGKTITATMTVGDGTVSQRTVTETGHDMFCPGTAMLFDGRLLVSGGRDSDKTSIYNPATSQWSSGQSMSIPRGYHSAVTLTDGRVFTIGGSWSGDLGGKVGEVWSASTGWRRLSGVPVEPILTNDPGGVFRADNHAWLFAASNGRVFHAGPSRQMNVFDTNGNGSFTPAGNRADDQDAMNGYAVMYDIGKILTTGGSTAYTGADASNRAYVIDIDGLNSGQVTTRRVADMAYPRTFHNSVVLPDGKVVVVGGQSVGRLFADTAAIFNAEMWDPATGNFTTLAPMSVPRNYHSVATLLPDGRVFSGGGGLCGNCETNHLDGQVLSPPYLFNQDGSPAARPAITSVPDTVRLGRTVPVTTDRPVRSFSMIRMGAVTHGINTDQRRVPVTATPTGANGYNVAMPSDPGVLVPGYYMLFAIDAAGVPSVAATVLAG